MGRLIYSVIGSLDGYLADADGSFRWAEPDEEVLAHLNAQETSVGVHLYGRRSFELMRCWERDVDPGPLSPQSEVFARSWQAVDKIVYSTTLTDVATRRTELRSAFDPDEIAALKESSASDLTVFGPTLAASAFAADLVEEFQVYLVPLLVGGGLRYFPPERTGLELRDVHRFGNGMVWLRYDVRRRREALIADYVADCFADYVAAFNSGVRTGDFSALVAQLDESCELVFDGGPGVTVSGRAAIAAEYAAHPPDDTITTGELVHDDSRVGADYRWTATPDTVAGRLTLQLDGRRIVGVRIGFAPG